MAHLLGIATTTLTRLEGRAYAPASRRGKQHLRVFTSADAESIRVWLTTNTRLGHTPELLSLGEVARRVGCRPATIRAHLGTELPAGRRLTKGERWQRGFTPGEAEEIVA